MNAAAAQCKASRYRLTQDAFNVQTLPFYAKCGFDFVTHCALMEREPMATRALKRVPAVDLDKFKLAAPRRVMKADDETLRLHQKLL